MNRRLILAGAVGALCAPFASAAATPAGAKPSTLRAPDGMPAAPTVGGAVPWEVLASTTSFEKTIDGFSWVLPAFPAAVKALDGKLVKVNGYMMPLEETPAQKRFLLMAYPSSCPYCLDLGAAYFIEVRAPKGVAFSYDAVLVEGRLELLEKDENGLFYRLSEARPVKA